ncbi:hypothetical protein V500_08341 [Pseudogymnoascus sp. VKM F-4518 (FW-2643)]|nr:hypothetical protein V500_08341 [Pseudogymnoascus sp. VKM F-4518 (FW-2643)]
MLALPHETDAPSPRRESPSRRLPLPGIGVHLPSQPQRRSSIALSQTRAGPSQPPTFSQPPSRRGAQTWTRHTDTDTSVLWSKYYYAKCAQPPSTRRALLSNFATQRVAVETLRQRLGFAKRLCYLLKRSVPWTPLHSSTPVRVQGYFYSRLNRDNTDKMR